MLIENKYLSLQNSSDDMINMGVDSIIRKKSLAEEVAEQLQRQITEGKLKEGDKLPIESELMKVFGVGRSTIREAVKMLLNRGNLSVQQGRGTFVESQMPASEPFEQRLKRADIRDLYDVRKILEAAIAERAALHRTEQDLKEIQKYVTERKISAKDGMLKECIEADIHFHVAVAKATHNEILFELYRSASIRLQKGYSHIYDDTRHFSDSQPLHEKLVKYIIDRNAPKASGIASQFWGDADYTK